MDDNKRIAIKKVKLIKLLIERLERETNILFDESIDGYHSNNPFWVDVHEYSRALRTHLPAIVFQELGLTFCSFEYYLKDN